MSLRTAIMKRPDARGKGTIRGCANVPRKSVHFIPIATIGYR
jgi:hypothetical protein